jgi:polyribonucleotide nucleotidyltransferase
MVIDVDPGGKVRMSRQAVLEGWSVEEAQSRDRGGRSSGGDRGSDRGPRRDGDRGPRRDDRGSRDRSPRR